MGIKKPARDGFNAPVAPPATGVPSVSNTSTPDVVSASGPADHIGHIKTPTAH